MAAPKPRTTLKKNDYLYALEVAGQPAKTAAEKAMKRQAKVDMKYLEEKYPKYTAKVKNFNTRVTMPEATGKFGGKTRIGKMSTSRANMRAE